MGELPRSGEHVLAGRPVGQFPDPPVPCTGSPAPVGGVPEATDAASVEPGNPQLHRPLIHVRKVRGDLCRVALENPQDRHHPIADPDISLCMHGLRQLSDLLVSLVHGWLVDLVIKKLFCLTALQEAKLFVSVTLDHKNYTKYLNGLHMSGQTTINRFYS